MKPQDVVPGRGGGELALDLLALPLESLQALAQGAAVLFPLAGGHDTVDRPHDLLQAFLEAPPGIALRGPLPLRLGLELLDEGLNQLGGHQLVLEAREHPFLGRLPLDGAAVVAAAVVAPPGAAVAVLADNRVAAAAGAAGEETREQELAAVCAVERMALGGAAHVLGDILLARLDGLPEGVIDDPELRHL